MGGGTRVSWFWSQVDVGEASGLQCDCVGGESTGMQSGGDAGGYLPVRQVPVKEQHFDERFSAVAVAVGFAHGGPPRVVFVVAVTG
jgi:hypothetical protein